MEIIMTENMISDLGITARWTAAVRAAESDREDRLFNDPWAAALAGKEGAEWIASRQPSSTLTMTLRTRYFDDFLLRVSDQEGIDQILLMAAGLDTRAFRLCWAKGTRLFELDQSNVLNYKDEILGFLGAQATCDRRVIPGDLTQPWKDILADSGFDSQKPSCWLLEGFLFYLPNEFITQLINQVTNLAAPGSWMGFDINNSDVLTSSYTKAWVDMQAQMGAPWIGTLDDPEAFLSSRGWQATLTQAGQPDANYGRWTLPIIPTKMANMPHNWFVTAKKA
jgi:methyltransferase (TIGR00027 family)